MADALNLTMPRYADHAFDGVLSRRVLAFLIDYAIIGLLLIPAGVVLFFLSILTLGLGFLLLPMIFFIVAGPYFALTLDFGTSMVHVLAFWIINSLLTPFPLLIGLFTERRRLVHDMLLGTYMVRASAIGY